MPFASVRKIGLIGRVDLERGMFDGQTVKTRMMHRLLCEEFGEKNLIVVDTRDYRRRALKVMLDVFRCLMACDDVFVLLSENGRRALFPLLAFMARKKGVKIYHNLIGGRLAYDLGKHPTLTKYLNCFQVNWVESHKIAKLLANLGVNNAKYLPNFKYFDNRSTLKLIRHDQGHWFCIFSRVNEDKGVGDAMHTVERIAAKHVGEEVKLDIYGPISDDYQDKFKSLLSECSHSRYLGCVEPEKSVETISGYDALLFPTKWKTEGMPGTIIDALYAGVPVISSRWENYSEMLEDGVTGLSYEFGDQSLLDECIEDFLSLGKDVRLMRQSCLERSKQYSPKVVAKAIREEIEQGRR